ncbi:hypothetical protein [Nonomuraea wenchangensis]
MTELIKSLVDGIETARVQHKRLDNDREPDFPRDMYQVDIYRLQFWPRR